jgi:hypothetical protein
MCIIYLPATLSKYPIDIFLPDVLYNFQKLISNLLLHAYLNAQQETKLNLKYFPQFYSSIYASNFGQWFKHLFFV